MARLRTPDDQPQPSSVQTFRTDRGPHEALDAAETYLGGAGDVAPPLQGRLVRTGDEIVVHYGRIRTHVAAAEEAEGSQVQVTRRGQAPLEEKRTLLFGLGLAGFVLAWGLAWYNSRADDALSPLVTITLFFLGITAVLVALYVVDRSLERRSKSLLRSLEDAVRGDPLRVLRREVEALERSSAIANALLFYVLSLFIEFVVFVVLLSDGVVEGINEAVTLQVMRAVFGIPVVPAILFGLGWYVFAHRLHRERLDALERHLDAGAGRVAAAPSSGRA